jgi:photoactive yellow protein
MSIALVAIEALKRPPDHTLIQPLGMIKSRKSYEGALTMQITDSDILSKLDSAGASQLDAEQFGIVKMDHNGKVLEYNSAQSAFTGVQKSNAIGKHFFSEVAPCTNNFMVSQQFESNSSLDSSIDYTFTLKMKPTPVKLRLLKSPKAQYLLVKKAA